ncbi:amino acid ABC transporter permease [Kineococcus sp. DHX-1]|uniref:amino acid ABC transporter permease n=1 Tax=Kineococcus sp. DHX-1 TaxID=3349638 RepID=UPI0036D34C8B
MIDNLDLFAAGFLRSLGLAAWAAVGCLVLGTVLAVFRVSPVPVLRGVGTVYVTLVRNTPLVIVLFFFVFAVPAAFAVKASNYTLAVCGLIVYTAAFVCEAVRSGIATVPSGQAEAARAIGLPFRLTLTEVVLPQALRAVVPPVGNVLIAMIKNSAVAGAVGVGGDLFAVYQRLVSAQGLPRLPIITGMAVGYLVITLSAALALHLTERKLAVAR